MKYTRLGTTDLEVSRICFGCWQLSPSFWGEVPTGPWADAVRSALKLGVNFIDTADAYGEGHAETELGKLLKQDGTRDQFVLATKFFWNFADGPRHPDTTPGYIRRACEASLQRSRPTGLISTKFTFGTPSPGRTKSPARCSNSSRKARSVGSA